MVKRDVIPLGRKSGNRKTAVIPADRRQARSGVYYYPAQRLSCAVNQAAADNAFPVQVYGRLDGVFAVVTNVLGI